MKKIFSLILLLMLTNTAMAFKLGDFFKPEKSQINLPIERLQTIFSAAETFRFSAEQISAVRDIMDNARPQFRQLLDELLANRKQIKAASEKGQFDEAIIRPLALAQGEINAEMIILKAKVKADLYNILNEEQLALINQSRYFFEMLLSQ